MWDIIKSELNYNAFKLLAFLVVIPFLVLIEFYFDDFPKLYIAFLLYFTILAWFLNANKEHRIIRYNILPVNRLKNAISRIIILLVITLAVYLPYIGLYWILKFNAALNIKYIFVSASVVLIVFGLSFVVRDLAFEFFRTIGLNKYNIKLVLVVIILALNLITVYAFMYTKSTGHAPLFFESAIRSIESHNPFAHPAADFYFVLAFCAVAMISILSYNKRKSYLE
jgi:hypothetical protein